MSPSSFFLLSFAGPIVAAVLTSAASWYARGWLRDHWVPPLLGIFFAFIGAFIATRKLIHYFVSVECPKCKKTTAFEMDAVACRFRCSVCWKEF